MERSDGLRQKRRGSEALLDNLAPIYDDNWGTIDPTHQLFIEKFAGLCPPAGTILDAACGAGKYWQIILATGRAIFGIHQSKGMLAQAKDELPGIPPE